MRRCSLTHSERVIVVQVRSFGDGCGMCASVYMLWGFLFQMKGQAVVNAAGKWPIERLIWSTQRGKTQDMAHPDVACCKLTATLCTPHRDEVVNWLPWQTGKASVLFSHVSKKL